MKRRGFTLIELLAVIVILAIIALIATPIITRVIEQAKKGAAERSADNYVRAVETTIVSDRMSGVKISDGTYIVDSDGNLCPSGEICTATNKVIIDFSGTKPEGSTIIIQDKEVIDNSILKVGDYTFNYKEGALEEGITSSIIYRFSTDSISIGDEINPSAYTTDATTLGNDFYLKHVVENNVVTESYMCVVVNDKESCVKGGSPDYYGYADNAANYTGNALILKGLQDEGLSCSFDMTNSVCTSSGSFSLTANSSGGVIASGPRGRCTAGGSSGSSCTVNG